MNVTEAIAIENVVFGVGSLLFALVVLPTILNKESRVPRTTSVPIILVLLSFLPIYVLLGTWFAFACNVAQALAWLLVAVYRPLKVEG